MWESFYIFWERRWIEEKTWWGDASGHAGQDGGWEYRWKNTALKAEEAGCDADSM